MASFSIDLLAISLLTLLLFQTINSQLSTKFYDETCPKVHEIVRETMTRAVKTEPRMGASILRLLFHDCFVQGCDASVLLDDTPTFTGEKNAYQNENSIRGFEVIDTIKSNLEKACRSTVSCADILVLATHYAVELLGGPSWQAKLGRHDSINASLETAEASLPTPNLTLSALISKFAAKGLNPRDMTALSGTHTIGQAHCYTYRDHIYNDININPNFAKVRQMGCPLTSGDGNLELLDESNPNYEFGNGFFKILVDQRGLLHSDQELFNHGSVDDIVKLYSLNKTAFFEDFVSAMQKMESLSPLIGNQGQIRVNCRKVNLSVKSLINELLMVIFL